MDMNETILSISPSRRAKEERDARICALYREWKGKIILADELYRAIAIEVGCSKATVVTVLKKSKVS